MEQPMEPPMESPTEPPMEQPMEEPMEQPMEEPMEQPMEQPMGSPTPARPRVRKVRVRAPTDTKPAAPPDPNYWNSRLQEHRSSQRLAKDERYGNLRIM
jgi:hypothetical protein